MGLMGHGRTSESRFATYVEGLSKALGHADRIAPLKAYCTGLILPGERKSVEPMAARVEPGRVQAAHQSLHHFVAKADWSDEAVLAMVRAEVLPAIERQGPIRAWIVDDTGFPKKGVHSVGVARQYCGQLGKQDNCQIAVSLSVANDHASLPVAWRLYLPEGWANDPARRDKAGVPEDVVFRTKPEIALDQIRTALSAGVPSGVVLADAGYGVDTAFRTGLTAIGLSYIVGIQSSTSLWSAGMGPLPPKAWSGRGRPPSLVRRDPEHKPVSARQLAQTLPESMWRSVTWREGTKGPLTSRFAAVRVRPAHRDYWRSAPRPEEWFLIEWPKGESEPDQILALDPAAGYGARQPRRHGQTALAHRAGLPGAQAGDRPRSLRRPRLARLPPSRHALHRRLRVPGLRAEFDFPLSAALRNAPQSTSPTQRLSTPRRRRFGPNATSPTRSLPSAVNSLSASYNDSQDVPAADTHL